MNENIAESIGMFLENKIREKILSDVPPPNAESTIKRKGSSHTLVDDGTLLSSVTHTVESEGEDIKIIIGILDPEIAEYAAPNEHGVVWDNRPKKGIGNTESREWFIPPRSFIRSTFDEEYENIISDVEKQIVTNVKAKLSGK